MSPTRRAGSRNRSGGNGAATATPLAPQPEDAIHGPGAPSAGPSGILAAPPYIPPQDTDEGDDVEIVEEDPELKALEDLAGPGLALVYRVEAGVRNMTGKLDRPRLIRDHEIIGQTWGGGEYEVDFKDSEGKYVKKFIRFRFDPRVYGPPKGSAAQTLAAPATGNDSMLTFFREQAALERERTNRAEERFMALLMKEQSGSKVDEVIRAAQLMAGVKSEQAEEKVLDAKDVIAKAVAEGVARLTPPQESSLVSLITEVVKAVPAIAPLITQLAAKQSAEGRVTAPPKAQRELTGPSAENQPKEDKDVDMYAMLIKSHPLYKENAPLIMGWARSRRDPAEAAEDVAARVPAEQAANVVGFLSRPDCWGWILRLEPEAKPFKPWFAELVKTTRELLTSPHEPAPDGTEAAEGVEDAEVEDNDTEGE